MRIGRRLSPAAVAVLLGLAIVARRGEGQPASNAAGTTGSAYAGSDACRPCHRPAWEAWQQSVHVRMTQPVASASLLGDFGRGLTVHDGISTYAAIAQDGQAAVRITTHGTDVAYRPQMTLGEKRFQGYIATLPDGRMYVLPMFWHVAWQRWVGWRDITPAPVSAEEQRQIWNVNCFNCHATNIQRNFDVQTRSFSTTWTEPGVGCEACHGPGREHITRLLAWGRDPRTYPDIDPARNDPELSQALAIFVPRTASQRQLFDSCAYCHGNKTNHFVGFAPGDALDDYAQPALVSDPLPSSDPQGDFWPDGRPSRFNRPQALTQSGCFTKGGATCATCHAAHGSSNEHSLKVPLARADELCTQCHQAVAPSHTHHASGSDGSRCVQCHMADVNWRLLMRRRDHTFAAPVPEITANYGIPNACTTCHEDRSPEWAAAKMTEWYGAGDVERRQRLLGVARSLYGAMAGDAGALPAVAGLAASRRNGALVRASAAGFAGRLLAQMEAADSRITLAVMNPLVAAASDPDSMVRAAATTALGNIDASRTRSALLARLTDPSRVVRIRAAESLLQLGVTALPGAAGEALDRAQREYGASLGVFQDVAAQHTSLGWLHAARGAVADARSELRLAVSLDPSDPRPLVFLGVLAAREGRFDTAGDLWVGARRLNPRYPNIDRMIAEVRTRQPQR